MTKTSILTVAMSLLLPLPGFAEVSGVFTPGGQIVNVVPNSSKFNEYRDVRDGFYLYNFGVASETSDGLLFDVSATNPGREDQNYRVRSSFFGVFGIEFEFDEIPHRLSNKAGTPFVSQGSGLLTAPATVTGLTKDSTPSAAQQTANDGLTADYLRAFVQPVGLGNEREKASVTFNLRPIEALKFRLSASNEDRVGNKVGYGPIGDRPPRTLNIQLAEPIDYRTREVKFEADYLGMGSQANFTYQLSNFWNHIDQLTWQNLWVNPAVGTFEAWADGDSMASFGRRPLPQDNVYHNVGLTYGVDLPWAGRLTAAASYGLAQQNSLLLPYSTSGKVDPTDGRAWNDPSKLARSRAQAEAETRLLSLDWVVNPIERLNLRAFGRYYGLRNNTPTSDWRYVTSDVVRAAAGTVTYINKRRDLAYDYNKRNYGLEGSYSLPLWATTFGLGYEREETSRDFREAGTTENIVRASARSRPLKWLSVRTKYQYGLRDAGHYEPEAAHGTYWYAPAEAGAGTPDSQFTFENHPDTRRWDVTDRERHQVDVRLGASPAESLDVSLSGRLRQDDYGSNVRPSQPLLNYAGGLAITAADRAAFSPGDQVGLLKDTRKSVALDMSYAATQRVRVSVFGSRDQADSRQRGFEFQENNKVNPSAIAAATELGPWTRRSMQWTADVRDTTYSYGLGAVVDIIPEKLAFNTNFTHSIGKVSIDYAGFGTQSSVNPANQLAPNDQFGFRSPPMIRNDRYVIGTRLEYQLVKNLTVGLGYVFEYFRTRDWQQEPGGTQTAETVSGNENMLRDTSKSDQWGNRLPNLGSYLASSYQAHLASLSMTYRF